MYIKFKKTNSTVVQEYPRKQSTNNSDFYSLLKGVLAPQTLSVSLTPNVPKDARRHNIPHPFQKELGFLLQQIIKSHTSLSITHPTPNITKAKFHTSAAISQWSKLSTFSHFSYTCNTNTQSQYCVLKDYSLL